MIYFDKNGAKAALPIVLIHFAATGTGLALLRFFNRKTASWNIGLPFILQDILFLLLLTTLLFLLVYRLSTRFCRINQLHRKNELRYHSLFEMMHKGGVVYRPLDRGEDFIFVDINRSGEQLDQLNRQSVMGQRASKVLPKIGESRLLSYLQRVYFTGTPEYVPISRYREKTLATCREYYLFPLDSGEVAILYDDVTEKKQLQEKLEQSKGELTLQNRIITKFLTTDDDIVFQVVLHIILEALQSNFGVFGYLNEEGVLVCPTLTTTYRKFYRPEERPENFPSNNWKGLWNRTLRDGKTMVQNSRLVVPVGHIALQNGVAAAIRYQEEIIGLICLANKDEEYTGAHITQLESICSYLAPILNARLHAQYNENLRFQTVVELVKSEASLKEAEKVAKIGHWEHHFANDSLSWSDEVYRIFAQDPKKFKPTVQALLQQVHPDDRRFVKKAFTTAMRNKTAFDEITHRLLLIDGTIKFVHERWVATYNNNGEPVRSLGTVQDITERIQAEKSSRRLATAIDQAVDVIMITDRKGLIQYVNPAFEKLTGYTSQEAVGQNWNFLKSGKHSQEFYRELWSTISSGKVWHGRIVNKTKSGELFTEDTTITPVRDDTGQLSNFVAVKHDISRELELEQQLRQAVKMEAIGTLAGGIAHDFNNILGAILGYTRMAMEALPQDGQPYRDLEKVIQSGDRAASLVQQILLFSRRQEEGFVPVQVEFLIRESVKMLRATLPASINVNVAIEPECPSILADPAQIHQILMNLCTNAKQSMLVKGGTLTISLTRYDIDDERDAPGDLQPGTYLSLAIQDTGSGISNENLTRIFDPFFTTKGIGEGTGLGLAVVHGIVKSHRGAITVKSELQQGTVFTIFFPETKATGSPSPQLPETMPGGKEHILVVDDEPDMLTLGQRMLTDLGYEVSTFAGSEEALASFREDPFRYDLLLTDMTMPNMNGKELAEHILAVRSDIPIILSTGYSELIDEQKISEHGIRAYLSKPTKPTTLASTIREVLDSKEEAAIPEQERSSSRSVSFPVQ